MNTITITKDRITTVVTNEEQFAKTVHTPRKVDIHAESILIQEEKLND